MRYIIGVIIVFTSISLILFYRRKSKRKSRDSDFDLSAIQIEPIIHKDELSNEVIIKMEMLPSDNNVVESNLVEIKSSKVLAHINTLIPELTQVGKSVKNTVDAIQSNGDVLYRAILPLGAKLSNSREIGHAVRGYYRNENGIKGHANFIATEVKNGNAIIASASSSIMGVASMVVGQYYMTQINAELSLINENISKISDFQENEFRSRVFSLITHVKTIADFKIEILDNNELRLSKILKLDNLEGECTQLLGQVNLTLARYTNKRDIDYKSYEKELKDVQKWFLYQQSLSEVLTQISELRYTLHFGTVSREQCMGSLLIYRQQVIDTQTKLTRWHQETIVRLNIEVDRGQRKKSGLEGIISYVPGLIKEEFNYKYINEETLSLISEQTNNRSSFVREQSELYHEDVQLIIKGDKVYYLPE